MSHSSKARKKAARKAKDAAEPERTEVRNKIRRGKVPRLSSIAGKIVDSFGMIFEVKAEVDKKAAEKAEP